MARIPLSHVCTDRTDIDFRIGGIVGPGHDPQMQCAYRNAQGPGGVGQAETRAVENHEPGIAPVAPASATLRAFARCGQPGFQAFDLEFEFRDPLWRRCTRNPATAGPTA
ncbi:MAG TPA: hypothetical protein VN442_24235 [Bryobacteraceae bacterium]|nr:hypothetical protein [Bryobacteraceae bacterium]